MTDPNRPSLIIPGAGNPRNASDALAHKILQAADGIQCSPADVVAACVSVAARMLTQHATDPHFKAREVERIHEWMEREVLGGPTFPLLMPKSH